MMPLSEKIKATKDTTNTYLNHYKYLDKTFNFFFTQHLSKGIHNVLLKIKMKKSLKSE